MLYEWAYLLGSPLLSPFAVADLPSLIGLFLLAALTGCRVKIARSVLILTHHHILVGVPLPAAGQSVVNYVWHPPKLHLFKSLTKKG